MTRFVYLLIIVVAIFSCTTTEQQEALNNSPKTLYIKEADIVTDVKISDVIELDSFVVLETTKEALIGRISKIKITEDRIYVMDDAIFCFDRKGHYINKFDRKGKGPNEYRGLSDFDIKDSVVVVEAYKRFFKLDKNLNLTETIKVPWNKRYPNGSKVLLLDNDMVVFQLRHSTYRYSFFDMGKKRFVSDVSKSMGKGDHFANLSLSASKSGKILTTLKRCDTVFQLTENSLLPYKIINFEHALSAEQQNQLGKFGIMEKRPFSTLNYMKEANSYYECDAFITFEYDYHQRNFHYMFDKKTGVSFSFNNNLPNDVFGCKWFPFSLGFYKNSIITWVEAIDLIANKDTLIVDIPEGLTEESNPVLVFYQPKFN